LFLLATRSFAIRQCTISVFSFRSLVLCRILYNYYLSTLCAIILLCFSLFHRGAISNRCVVRFILVHIRRSHA
jgi:hypothetical protein